MWLAWTSGGLAVIVLAVMMSMVRIRVSFRHQGSDEDIGVVLSALFGLVRLKLAVPVIRFKGLYDGIEVKSEQINVNSDNLLSGNREMIDYDKIKKIYDKIMLLLHNCFHFDTWLRRMMCHVHCTGLSWRTAVGIGDAAETAFLVGALWGVKTSILGFLFRFIKLDAQPQLQVIPAFNRTEFAIDASIDVQVRVWHALSGGIQLLLRILRIKGGLQTWRRVLTRPH